MKATTTTFRRDAIVSAIVVVKAGYIQHQCFDGLQLPGGHLAHFFNSFRSASSTFKIEATSFWATKKEGLSHTPKLENETNPLRYFQYSDDFSDGMNETEQKPDDQGESSDETAHDDIQGEDADCA